MSELLNEERIGEIRNMAGRANPALMGKFVSTYIATVKPIIEELANVPVEETEKIEHLSHKLAGASANIGADKLFKLGKEMQKKASLYSEANYIKDRTELIQCAEATFKELEETLQ